MAWRFVARRNEARREALFLICIKPTELDAMFCLRDLLEPTVAGGQRQAARAY